MANEDLFNAKSHSALVKYEKYKLNTLLTHLLCVVLNKLHYSFESIVILTAIRFPFCSFQINLLLPGRPLPTATTY